MQLRTSPEGSVERASLGGLARRSIYFGTWVHSTLSRFEPDSLSPCDAAAPLLHHHNRRERKRGGGAFRTISLGASDYDLKSRIKGKIPATGSDRMLFLAHRKGEGAQSKSAWATSSRGNILVITLYSPTRDILIHIQTKHADF